MTEQQVQSLLAQSIFKYWKYVVIPNVAHGFLPYEADLIAISKAGCAHEIEIKVDARDVLAEAKKRTKIQWHESVRNKMSYFWFAGPESLKEVFEANAPEHWGIILFREGRQRPCYVRPAKRMCGKLSLEDQLKLGRLGVIRYWSRRFEAERKEK